MLDNDILSQHPDAIPIGKQTGYVVKCSSAYGICFEDKTKSQFYIKYNITEYRDNWTEFNRTEYYLPKGTLIYIHDCMKGHTHCNSQKIVTVAALFKQYFGKEYMTRKKSSKSKPKVKKCGCKK
jgi:hypothetical protein